MKHILHIINGDFFSGAERVQDILALKLPEFGYDIFFACLKPGMFKQFCLSNKERIHSFKMVTKFDLRQSIKIARFAATHDCRLIHSHTPRAALIGRLTAAISGLPMIHHVHSPTHTCTENQWKNMINPFIENLSIKKNKKIIAVSASIQNYLESKNFSTDIITCIPNGVPTPGPLDTRSTPTGRWTLGVIALFRPRKGIEVLLESLALLKSKKYNFTLRAVGQFETLEYENKIKKLAEELNLASHINWIGFKKNINNELKKMDIFILPSLFGEGTPMVILEAMAVGVPVIATKVGGIPKILISKSIGSVVEPNNKFGIAEAAENFFTGETDWSTIRNNAYQLQCKQYSDVRMAKDVAAIYKNILDE